MIGWLNSSSFGILLPSDLRLEYYCQVIFHWKHLVCKSLRAVSNFDSGRNAVLIVYPWSVKCTSKRTRFQRTFNPILKQVQHSKYFLAPIHKLRVNLWNHSRMSDFMQSASWFCYVHSLSSFILHRWTVRRSMPEFGIRYVYCLSSAYSFACKIMTITGNCIPWSICFLLHCDAQSLERRGFELIFIQRSKSSNNCKQHVTRCTFSSIGTR